VGAYVLVYPGTFRQPTHNPGSMVAVHPITMVVQKDGSILSVTDREVDGSGSSWSHRDQLGFASFTDDPERVVTSLQTHVTNISTQGFGHS
jgi:hypothetical protein